MTKVSMFYYLCKKVNCSLWAILGLEVHYNNLVTNSCILNVLVTLVIWITYHRYTTTNIIL